MTELSTQDNSLREIDTMLRRLEQSLPCLIAMSERFGALNERFADLKTLADSVSLSQRTTSSIGSIKKHQKTLTSNSAKIHAKTTPTTTSANETMEKALVRRHVFQPWEFAAASMTKEEEELHGAMNDVLYKVDSAMDDIEMGLGYEFDKDMEALHERFEDFGDFLEDAECRFRSAIERIREYKEEFASKDLDIEIALLAFNHNTTELSPKKWSEADKNRILYDAIEERVQQSRGHT